MALLPSVSDTVVQFAHGAYRLEERYALTAPKTPTTAQAWDRDALAEAVSTAHVLVASGYWDNALLANADNLRFIQVCAAGYDNYDLAAIAERGIRLCNSSGVNAIAVTEHALALTLALTRRIHIQRDFQQRSEWRGMISSLSEREEELAGKTVIIYGAGTIGSRLSRLMKAFEARTIGIRRNIADGPGDFDELCTPADFADRLPEADVVVLTCPLTDETRHLMNAKTLDRMRSDAYLINVARGGCVDESALVAALEAGKIAGAGIDVTEPEPLPSTSSLWGFENVMLTSHTAGETRAYEDRVVAILNRNLARLWAGDAALENALV
jgi:D-2-hydroxyacid dehydrogenase (NADP+)